MSIIRNIKRWFFYRVLRQKDAESNRTAQIFNINTATSFGILYNASTAENTALVTTFANTLKQKGKEVFLLGYVNDKKTESSELMKLFNKKSLNWYKIPNNKEADVFMNRKIDVLVAVHTLENLPLQYIAANSNAKFRIGPHIEKSSMSYDWMIQIQSDTTVENYLKQVLYYLEHIQHN